MMQKTQIGRKEAYELTDQQKQQSVRCWGCGYQRPTFEMGCRFCSASLNPATKRRMKKIRWGNHTTAEGHNQR